MNEGSKLMQKTNLIVHLGLLGAFCGFNLLESKKKSRKEGLVRVCVCVCFNAIK